MLLLVRQLSGPGEHPPSRSSVGDGMEFSRLSPRSALLLKWAVVNRPRTKACPSFPFGAAFSWDFSAAPASATPQLCSSYVCAQSPTSTSLTWTPLFSFLAWPRTCLTAADLLGGHCTVSDPDQSLNHCLLCPEIDALHPPSLLLKTLSPHTLLSHLAAGSPFLVEQLALAAPWKLLGTESCPGQSV